MYEFSDEYFSKEYKHYLEIRDKGLKKEGHKILENLMLYFNKLDESTKETITDELFTFRYDRFSRLPEFQHQLHIQVFPILEKMCSENTHWQEAYEYYRELFSNWHKYNSENTNQTWDEWCVLHQGYAYEQYWYDL